MARDYARKDDPKGAPRTPKNSGKDDAVFRGYINVDLTREQKEGYDAWASSSSFWEALEGQAARGVNLSVKRVPGEGTYIASGTQRDPTSPNAGLVVTARAGDAAKALGRLLFTLVILDHKPKWEDTQPMADPDRW